MMMMMMMMMTCGNKENVIIIIITITITVTWVNDINMMNRYKKHAYLLQLLLPLLLHNWARYNISLNIRVLVHLIPTTLMAATTLIHILLLLLPTISPPTYSLIAQVYAYILPKIITSIP